MIRRDRLVNIEHYASDEERKGYHAGHVEGAYDAAHPGVKSAGERLELCVTCVIIIGIV